MLACLLSVVTPAAYCQTSVETKPFLANQAESSTVFTKMPDSETGLDFISRLIPDHPLSYLYHSGMTCSGIAAGDVDGDGKPDLFLANGPGRNALYLQAGPAMHFEDVTAEAAMGLDGGDDWASGVAMADVDNDGDLDLYVCNYEAPNKLYINQGASENSRVHFEEFAEPAGVNVVDASHAAAFCDYDNDGDLDFFLLTNRVEDPRGQLAELPVEFKRPGVPSLLPGYERYHSIWVVDADNWGVESQGRPDYLFRNDGTDEKGKVHFTDVTKASGISGRGDGLSSVWWDVDRDGDCDLYVCNDFISPDRFYINNGNGTFTNKIAETMPHTTWFSMGSDFGDLDNDGDFDLLVADMSATSHYKSKVTMGVMGGITLQRANESNPPQYMRNALYVNEGQQIFREAAYMAGLSSTDWTWAIKMNDFDADGMLDVFMTNGVPREMNHSDINITQEMLAGKHMWEFFKKGKMRKEQNRAFRNEGNLKFTDTSKAWGLDHVGASYGSACADFDQDGDLDIAMVNLEENVFIYRNDGKHGSQITLKLNGKESNRNGVGALVEIVAGDKTWLRQLMPSRGYHSYDEPILHFGLGDVEKIDRVVVRWPSGITQTLIDVAVNQQLPIDEGVSGTEVIADLAKPKPLFVKSNALGDFWHQENKFDDFKLQPLLPHRLSSEGPCMAWADVDGNGMADVFVGGSAGVPAELRLCFGLDDFRLSNARLFFSDRKGEDAAAVFGDFDNDGDQDLLVGRGSYEFKAGDELQQNLLYLNDGKGGFQKATDAIPVDAFNTGTLTTADFDSDGDVDVFVGTRVKAASYPLSTKSSLWINNGGQFTDQTSQLAEGLTNAGMVTDARWADFNGDSAVDLLVSREWGTIGLFIQENGKLVERNAGEMTSRTGWWNAVAAADFDGDGDLDVVASNVGLNTKYKTSDAKPMTVYYGQFDDSGDSHIVEVKLEGTVCYPERGRSCSSNAMPFIAKKFGTFHDFGKATLSDIYGDDKLNSATKLEASTFEHTVFINDGDGKFIHRSLPRISQIAPSKSVAVADLDGDGDTDIVLGQNFFGPQSETGRYDGGLGQFLMNDGSGNFSPLPPGLSGFAVREATTAVEVRDIDGDGKVDIVAATNDGPLNLLINQSD